jgi:PKD repeat protein
MVMRGSVSSFFWGLLILLFSAFLVPKNGFSQNLPPVVNMGIPNQHAEVGSLFSYTIPSNSFRDENIDQLTLTAGTLPLWLTFDATTRTLSGTPLAQGTVFVTISASDPSGLSAAINFSIKVHPSGSHYAAFTMNVSQGCNQQAVQFINRSKGATSYSWTFGNGNSSIEGNPGTTYIKPGTYTVTLTINGGGSPELTHTETVFIYPRPQPNIVVTPSGGCEPFSTQLNSSSGPVFSSGYTAENGQEVGSITGGAETYYSWYFYEAVPGSVTYTPSTQLNDLSSGSYNAILTVTDENGCQGSAYRPGLIQSFAAPKALFSYQKADLCRPSMVNFTNQSTLDNGTITKNEWYINDVLMGNERNFNHDFTASGPGIYIVKLISESSRGCRSIPYTDTIRFNHLNETDFFFSTTCFGDTTHFTSTTSAGVIGYDWDFNNDGVIDANTASPGYRFPSSGLNLVRLTTRFNDGCNVSTAKQVGVESINVAIQQTTLGYCPYSIQFTGQAASDINSSIIEWQWWLTFPNGDEQLVSTNSSFVYNNFVQKGTYAIRLITKSQTGCVGSAIRVIDLSEPDIQITTSGKTYGCLDGSATNFFASFSKNDETASSYYWDFGDGTNATTIANNVSHTYTAPGNYSVTVTITTPNGCQYSKSKEAVRLANPPSITSFLVQRSSNCYSTVAMLETNYTSGTDSLIFELPAPDNTRSFAVSGTNNSYPYQFPNVGTYSITVTALDNGCPSVPALVAGTNVLEPKVSFSTAQSSYCDGPSKVQFTNTSNFSDPSTLFTWNFGDGSDEVVNNGADTSHTYTNVGSYTVTLNAQSPNGCSHSWQETINIFSFDNTPGVISASATTGCVPLTVTFNQSIRDRLSSNFEISELLWDFDNDGTVDSREEVPSHTYSRPGSYAVSLQIRGRSGCDYTFPKATLSVFRALFLRSLFRHQFAMAVWFNSPIQQANRHSTLQIRPTISTIGTLATEQAIVQGILNIPIPTIRPLPFR